MEAAGLDEPAARHRRDIVVVGASEGGIDALSGFVAALPAELPAAVFVAVHSRPGPLRARYAIHVDRIVKGRIYVAPPDTHLQLRPGYIQVVRGPKENGFRPSVDALFRTASIAYGPRVIGVLLTGNLDCGTAGLLSIKARAGLALVQDPREAAVPAMPRSAIQHVTVDHVAGVASLARLVATRAAESPDRALEKVPLEIAELEGDELGVSAEIVCPICQGKLTETI